ncbi:hypothetical protein HK099_001669 [Clydaea vesicula]|uniref:Uncharacterized protein n=1 Tax=Clydaea vesicula TaxID=447962 RepID=A0AAD5U7J1_9FUNG|nr:hypothetical protein HK099_001669 [Clydaea vesicula]KAJ3394630.1 hypothetical protein HDU92_006735 [Lobulomyces angularis]
MARSDEVTARLTDTSKYTGSHKERFDEDGNGKGIQGRSNRVLNDGSTSSSSRNHELDGSVKLEKKVVVKPKTDSETYGSKPKVITVYQYADKNHTGEKYVMTKQKFPTVKQLNEATIKLIPTGKPKLLLNRDLKEVKFDDLVDGEKYLSITAFDLKKLETQKLPAKFN